MPRKRIALLNVNMTPIKLFDISEIDNANSQCPIKADVQIMCNMGHWHSQGMLELPLWGGKDYPQ